MYLTWYSYFFFGTLPSNFLFEYGILILKLQNLRYDIY